MLSHLSISLPDGSAVAGSLRFVFWCLLVVVVAVTLITQIGKTLRARAAVANDQAYRQLAQEVAEANRATVAALADIQPRLAAIEKMMSSVD